MEQIINKLKTDAQKKAFSQILPLLKGFNVAEADKILFTLMEGIKEQSEVK